jgi:hypothetical protein
MRIASWVALVAAVVCGCGGWAESEAKPLPHWRAYAMTGPDGGEAYRINCGQNVGYCFEGAGISCPRGYRVVGSSDQSAYATSSDGSGWSNGTFAVARGSAQTNKRYYGTIVVECRPPATAASD